ncbi:Thermostable monoacylglycerol lipase [Halomicronema hongdechloris C2206]|uniref:Thermostable monoacylglycerol lipase n=1 Tax=Halomicronema hongdechloris C2206 TaxID=1641165 RepID=A0A1Z3HSX4_9CYAN|nr:alpha/beta fold hydrolase [Halomicronema hongdechloris]ASC73366.1 Thermostable monoacylglycerol lipase [Halomicronema hongdechloris C2206]
MMLLDPPYFSGFEALGAAENVLMPEAYPHWLRADSPGRCGVRCGVICVHGFAGVPYEVTPVAKDCVTAGMDAVTMVLPGHGYRQRQDQRRQFARITMDGLLQAARQEIAKARQYYDRVGMFGLSMGGAIALTMAAEGRLDACAVAAPALRLPLRAEILIPLLGWASFYLPSATKPSFDQPCYDFYHSWALRQLYRLSRQARRQLPQIQVPTLVVHSHCDRIIPAIVVDWITAEVPAPVEVGWFDASGHAMLLDCQGAAVARRVVEFFERHLAPT